MKLKRLDTSESKDIEKKNKSQLSDKMEKQINHQNPQEFHRSYQDHLKKIGVVHNGADVLMQQNSYSSNFSASYSGTVVPDRNENQAESHRLPNAALDYRELNLQSLLYRNQYMQRIEIPALMINKKKILCQVPKVTHEDVEWGKSDSHPIYREHVLLSNSTKQKQVVEINEQSQSTISNENHVSDYMNQDNQSEQNQTDIRLMELQRQFEEHPNGNLRKHYESERIPFYEKAEEKLENVKNPFTDLEDNNIQLVDIRLLELEREFRSHPNGNPAKQYKSQNYSSHISEEYQGAERKNKVAVNVEKDSDFIKKNRIQMEVVTPIEIGDEQSEIEIDIRRLELERNLTEDALDGDSLKDKKSLDRVSQKIERQKNRILEENRYFQIGENPETIFGSQQIRGTAYGEDLESESPFNSEENERFFDEMVKDQEGENLNQEHTDTEKSKKKEKDDSEKSSYFVKSRKIGKIAQNAEKISNLSRVIDHEMNALYDSEERKKSAAKDYITGKIKGKIKGSAASAAKKAGKKVAEKTVVLAIQGVKAVASFLIPFLPIVGIIIVISGIIIGIGAGVAEYESQQQQGGGQGGYFGKMYYWIEYETGKTDDTAFATVLGDGGRAFGIQFDYEYALQPFMNYCYNRNPIAYVGFQPYLSMPKSNLLGNQQLAKAWTIIFETNKEAFIQDQKDFAKENYYDGIERRAEQAGIKLKDRDEVCKGAVLSYSFQCGGSAAYQAVEELRAISDDEEFLKQIYAVRTREFSRFQDRYKRELETALSLLHGQGDFVPPVDMSKCVVTSEFGEYRSPSDPSHKGTDFGSIGAVAVPTYAIGDGTVLIAGYSSSAGNWVVIDHGNGLVAKYMHHESIKVRVGQQVKKGEQIGNMGTTGDSTGVHLHLQLELNGVPVNPRNYITF